ncbi:unnamed protein product [Notodromas monacha]|uniref:Uncharacterized protein n=1 Tax=Notodromas monacha TaxID=399045 RepID=A0A7R9BF65_9CRUS|nr:unnamed protein product [Notodromas monacha]CAG0914260.1 unnamed protein product [Notodromas monacha]
MLEQLQKVEPGCFGKKRSRTHTALIALLFESYLTDAVMSRAHHHHYPGDDTTLSDDPEDGPNYRYAHRYPRRMSPNYHEEDDEVPMSVNRGPSPDYTSNDDRAPSDRDLSEYSMEIETKAPRNHGGHTRTPLPESHYKSNLQVASIYKSPSELSYHTYKSGGPPRSGVAPSESATTKTKTSRYGRIQVDTVAAPHPYCPNTKGTCCLMVLFNLALIIVVLGFIVVLQIRDPPPLWYFGICMLIFGFCTLVGTLIYCVYVCRDRPDPNTFPYGEQYWTHHWRRSLDFGEKPKQNEIFYPPDDAHSFRNDDAFSNYSYAGGPSTLGRTHRETAPKSAEYYGDFGSKTRPGRY